MSSEDSNRRDFVQALARGLQVIEAFSREAPEMTLTDVAKRTGMTPATARRCLLTLEALGYVHRSGRRFVLTARVLSVGGAFADSMNLREVAHPALQAVVDRFQGSASMTILHGNEVVYLAHVAAPGASLVRHYVGARLPAHATSTGHVLIAHLDSERLAGYLDQAPFPRYTARTPTSRDDVVAALELVRARGYAAVHDTVEYGAAALAVAVRAANGAVIAAVNTSDSTTRIDVGGLVETRLPALVEAAARIEEALVRFPALARSV